MILILITYLLFQIAYDHWGDSGAVWTSVYFAAQFALPAAVSFYQWAKTKKLAYVFTAIIFLWLTISELAGLAMDETTFEKMHTGPPMVALTAIVIFVFIIFEIVKKWKKVSE